MKEIFGPLAPFRNKRQIVVEETTYRSARSSKKLPVTIYKTFTLSIVLKPKGNVFGYHNFCKCMGCFVENAVLNEIY